LASLAYILSYRITLADIIFKGFEKHYRNAKVYTPTSKLTVLVICIKYKPHGKTTALLFGQ